MEDMTEITWLFPELARKEDSMKNVPEIKQTQTSVYEFNFKLSDFSIMIIDSFTNVRIQTIRKRRN